MADNTNLKVDELNFSLIKGNLKNYLQSQDNFRDYNFEASGLSTLLDILAYNTYYNAFYLNMAVGENFLSSAQKRNSVVNLAKSLNYIPRSTTSAKIIGTVTLTAAGGAPSIITLPQYTQFTGIIDGTTYTFVTTQAETIISSSGVYSKQITLTEGKYLNRRYSVVTSDVDQRFLIPNTDIDTHTITVTVLNSTSDSTSRSFILADNIVNVDNESQVYFLEAVEDGQYEIRFGDGNFGVALENGNIVIIEYLISSGSNANEILNITYTDSVEFVTGATFVATEQSSGGAERESINSIKFNAPKNFEAQNRAITAEDFKSLISSQPNVDSVIAWGGEDNDPPTYGKVFIAVKPTTGSVLTAIEKLNLINGVIKQKKLVTVGAEIVDPEYIYLLIDLTVKYDATATSLTAPEVETLVRIACENYNDTDLDKFSRYFRYSKLSRLVDSSERSILNSILSVRLRKEQSIQLGVGSRYEIKFSNAIDNTTEGRPANHPYNSGNKLTSNAFTFLGFTNCFLEENNGIIRIYRSITETNNIGLINNAGTLNYDTGIIVLTNFAPTAFADGTNTLKLTAIPAEKDILPLRNQIISIRDADINITMLDDNSISLVSR